MSLSLVFGRDDPARTRFVVSPLWETMHAIRVTVEPQRHQYHLPWLEAVRAEVERLDLRPLLMLSPQRGWTPDFLSPVPDRPVADVPAELARVRATPPEQVAHEVRRSLTERSGAPVAPGAWQLLDDPAATRDLVADLLEQSWELLVAPHWPRLRDFLDTDVAFRIQTLADYGLERVLADLHPRARWTGRALVIQGFGQSRCLLNGPACCSCPACSCGRAWPRSPTRRPAPRWLTRPGASRNCGSQPGPRSRTRWPGCSAGPGPRCWSHWLSPPRPTPWPGGTNSPRAPYPSTSPRCATPGW